MVSERIEADKKAKPTRGPWTVFCKPTTKTLEIQAKGKAVVHWMGFDGVDQRWPQRVANAHVMAAGPDLLAALEEALPYLQGDHFPVLVTDKYGQMLDRIEAAVAKAKGGRS